MKYAQIRKHDVANGPGIRVTIFVSGCDIHCPKCFNQEYQDREYGEEFKFDTIKEILDLIDNDYISGLSILGGEPFEFGNYDKFACLYNLVMEFRAKFKNTKNIWIWSGHTFKELINEGTRDIKNDTMLEILNNCDVLVDGPYKDELRDMNLVFRGSKNQRIIDLDMTFNNPCGDIIQVNENTLIH